MVACLALPMPVDRLSRWGLRAGLLLSLGLAVLAPLPPLAGNRFHHDEAVYSTWALGIASGRDVMVSGSPVDKPPLFLYLQALSFVLFGATEAAARLPSLAAHLVSTLLIARLGLRLYGRGAGLLAAFFWAASPFAILFAATAFTDTLMVMFALAACLTAVARRLGWAGVALGLAMMTKPQGLFFLPLVIGLGWRSPRDAWKRFALGLMGMLCLALIWDVARGRRPGFLEQSLLSYGGVSLPWEAMWQRLSGFVGWLYYATASPALNMVLIVGVTGLLLGDGLVGWLRRRRSDGPGAWLWRAWCLDGLVAEQETRAGSATRSAGDALRHDLLLNGFLLLFLLGHALVGFQIWDRYMLGAVPCILLLLARILVLPWNVLRAGRCTQVSEGTVVPTTPPIRHAGSAALSAAYAAGLLVLLSSTLPVIRDAAASRFPIGGDHGAYDGLDQVVAYFKTVPADTTFYHRWLGAHWRFYLWGSPYDFRMWRSPEDLAAQASARPGARRYIVFPSWRSATEARLALHRRGLVLREVLRTFRRDGSVSFIVYRIEEAQ
ncbi:MAG: glycosyltransferase family 39 protein [Anaerolineae bacterium]|nr:glycosyltransferase family 39 protein [Anaerolineae bacterium]MDW8069968.1 glycosyltransferase family 39 protein [Anaerolineae bacterium]